MGVVEARSVKDCYWLAVDDHVIWADMTSERLEVVSHDLVLLAQ